FGLLGLRYRTDNLGVLFNYITYVPALIFLGLVYIGKNPATTIGAAALTLLVMLACIAPFLGAAVLRSERFR
ncbi:hypothetical protein, partial [Sphingomonas echinoides]|uniref:hypothetical protein n=1 Tax=Sphingomonas echinoides TaxID=59803 RepID=UPI001B7FC142